MDVSAEFITETGDGDILSQRLRLAPFVEEKRT